jgi:hypothetical protein
MAAVPLPLGAVQHDAWEAKLLVRQRQLQAQARHTVDKTRDAPKAAKIEDALLRDRAKRALNEREPAPISAWEFLQRQTTPDVDELLANGYTYYELVASGASLSQLISRLRFEQLVELGCTYESLLAADAAKALRTGVLTLANLLQFATLSMLIRDRVIQDIKSVAALAMSADDLKSQGVTMAMLVNPPLAMRVQQMPLFNFSLYDWVNVLEFKHEQLGVLGFKQSDCMYQCSQLGFDITEFNGFTAHGRVH